MPSGWRARLWNTLLLVLRDPERNRPACPGLSELLPQTPDSSHSHAHSHAHAACHHTHGAQHIYVYSPSGAVRDKAAFRRGIKRLTAMGHSVEVDPDALASDTRFAGDDATRLAAIHRAAASGADVALITRGGYGLTRILPGIHVPSMARAIEQGMRFIGMSDFTALQLAVLAQTGGITWAGPLLLGDLGVPGEPDDIMLACLDDLFSGQGEGAGWRLPRQKAVPTPSVPELPQELVIDEALLWGGNLAVLCALLGTPFFPQVDGGILFLEDVAEHPYRIERMLTQLLHAGVLGRQQAIVLGQFTGYQRSPHDRGFTLQTVVHWLRRQLSQGGKKPVPVLTGLPFGHVPTKVLLPVGAKTTLTLEARDALLVWGHM